MAKVCVVIPAYNEADKIGDTVKAVKNMPGIDSILVVDDGSTDNTSEVAQRAGADVFKMFKNMGKGTAMNRAVTTKNADIYLFIDADLGSTASETYKLIEPVLSGEADMSIAIMNAPKGHKGGFGFVKKLASWGIKKYGGSSVISPISGQRAMTRTVIDAIGCFEKGFGVETAMTIDALQEGFTIIEVPLSLTHRVSGRNLKGFMHRGRQFLDIARAIWLRRG